MTIPSNRAIPIRNSKVVSVQEQGVGFHRLTLSFAVGPLELSSLAWSRHNRSRMVNGVEWETAETFLSVGEMRDVYFSVRRGYGGYFAKVEFTPGTVMGSSDPCYLASLADLQELVPEVWAASARIVDPAVPLEGATVKRIDYARDFQVLDPAFWVRALLPWPRRFARFSRLHVSPSTGRAETLTVGSGSGRVNLYDKYAEQAARGRAVPSLVKEGTLRWELQAFSGWLARRGIRVWRDVAPDSIAALVNDRWEWSGMGLDVASASVVVQKVREAGLSPAQERGFLGHLVLLSMGQEALISSSTAAKFNRLIRDLKIVVGPDLFSSTFYGHLDFETGEEVLQVA